MTRLLRYYGCSDSCRSGPFQRTATASDRSLCFMHITFGPFRLQPPDAFQGRFCTLPLISLDFPCGSGLHPSIPGSPPHPAESSSPGPLSHCPHDGLVVHLGLLSTLPRGNAVISSYGPENVCPTGTCTLLIVCTHRRTTAGVSPAVDPRSRWYSIANGCSGDKYRFEDHDFCRRVPDNSPTRSRAPKRYLTTQTPIGKTKTFWPIIQRVRIRPSSVARNFSSAPF